MSDIIHQATAQCLRELMQALDKIMAAAREQFPGATDEEIYQIIARRARAYFPLTDSVSR